MMVMDLGQRGSLADVLRSASKVSATCTAADDDGVGGLPWARRLAIAMGIAAGIDFLHTQKPMIVHRALPPRALPLLAGRAPPSLEGTTPRPLVPSVPHQSIAAPHTHRRPEVRKRHHQRGVRSPGCGPGPLQHRRPPAWKDRGCPGGPGGPAAPSRDDPVPRAGGAERPLRRACGAGGERSSGREVFSRPRWRWQSHQPFGGRGDADAGSRGHGADSNTCAHALEAGAVRSPSSGRLGTSWLATAAELTAAIEELALTPERSPLFTTRSTRLAVFSTSLRTSARGPGAEEPANRRRRLRRRRLSRRSPPTAPLASPAAGSSACQRTAAECRHASRSSPESPPWERVGSAR